MQPTTTATQKHFASKVFEYRERQRVLSENAERERILAEQELEAREARAAEHARAWLETSYGVRLPSEEITIRATLLLPTQNNVYCVVILSDLFITGMGIEINSGQVLITDEGVDKEWFGPAGVSFKVNYKGGYTFSKGLVSALSEAMPTDDTMVKVG